jgi:hypothetical protein
MYNIGSFAVPAFFITIIVDLKLSDLIVTDCEFCLCERFACDHFVIWILLDLLSLLLLLLLGMRLFVI